MPGRKAPEAARREQILEAACRVAVRRRLGRLTVRDVAREAKLSTGLVLFHFKSKEALIAALLEWLLRSSAVLQPSAHAPVEAGQATSLCALVSAEASRLSLDRLRAELFFDFWVAGTRTVRLQTQMRRALVQYRQAFRTRAATLLRDARCSSVAADGLAAAAVSFIHGSAMQAVIDPDAFNLNEALAVLELIGQRLHGSHDGHLASPSAATTPRPRRRRGRRPSG